MSILAKFSIFDKIEVTTRRCLNIGRRTPIFQTKNLWDFEKTFGKLRILHGSHSIFKIDLQIITPPANHQMCNQTSLIWERRAVWSQKKRSEGLKWDSRVNSVQKHVRKLVLVTCSMSCVCVWDCDWDLNLEKGIRRATRSRARILSTKKTASEEWTTRLAFGGHLLGTCSGSSGSCWAHVSVSLFQEA